MPNFTSQTEWGKIVAAKLRAELVTKSGIVFNENYQGDAATAAAVMIPRTPEATLKNYNKGDITQNTVTYDSNAWITSTIDKDKAVNELIDKRNMQTVSYDEIQDKLDAAGYAFASDLDTHGLQVLINAAQGKDKAGNTYVNGDPRYTENGVETTATSDFYADILATRKTLRTNKATPEYLIVDPEGEADILDGDSKIIRQGDLSQKLIEEGAIGKVAGLVVLSSNNMPNTTDQTPKGVKGIISGKKYATRILAWVEEPYAVDAKSNANIIGGVLVQGRAVYTHDVTQPKAVGIITYTLS